VPIHLLAFTVLYVATDRLLEFELVALARALAGERLSQAASQVRLIAGVQMPGEEGGHSFVALTEDHREINFRLFLPGGALLGPQSPAPQTERNELAAFLRAGENERFWLASRGGLHEMRGLQRVMADGECVPCNTRGKTLAVASMTMDLTDQVGQVTALVRRNLALLLIGWAAALGVTNAIVSRSVKRSAAHLEAELAAAEAGNKGGVVEGRGVVLDPGSAELHQSLLRGAQRQREREAEVASRLAHTDQLASLGQLAAGLAHEIKNPLAGIQGALEIMRQDLESEPDRELCGRMLAELDRVNETLQSLLTSAKPSPPRRRMVDLQELLEDVRRLMAPGLRRRGVALEVETPPDELLARIDSGKIRQVLVNLVTNAADALDGEGRIELRAGHLAEQGGAIIAVEDNGPGIPAEQAAKVFDPFFTTKFAGTGLGLSIARSLVEQHGGTLELETEPGKGTTFYLVLPSSDQAASESSAQEA
jgi:signal transduction histidine kinase